MEQQQLEQRPEDGAPTFSSDHDGLREAAAEVSTARELGNAIPADDGPPAETEQYDEVKLPELDKPKTDDMGFHKGVTVKDAAEALADHREQKKADREAFERKVLGTAEPLSADEVTGDTLSRAERALELLKNSPELDSVKAALSELEQAQTEREALHRQAAALEQRARQAEAQAAAVNVPASVAANTVTAAYETTFTPEERQAFGTDIDGLQRYLAQTGDPRMYRLQEIRNAAALTIHQAQWQSQAQQHQVQRQQFEAWAQQEDSKFEARHTELRNPQVAETLRKGAIEYLTKERGLTTQQVNELYHGNGQLRSAEAQSMLLDATRQYLARKGIANRPRAKVPTVQRPGTASNRSAHAESEVRHLDERLSLTASAKDAAKLVSARRRAR